MWVADPVARVLWGLIIVLVAGLAVGTWLNRRRSRAIGRWIQAGLKPLGGTTSWRWIRGMSSGARVTVADASKPFRQVEISYFLLTREFPPLWGVELLRGKRDLLAFRAVLRDAPAHELEIVPREGKLRRALDAQAGTQPLVWQEASAGLGIGIRTPDAAPLARRARQFLESYGSHIQRLSLRRREPHLILFLQLEGRSAWTFQELLAALRRLLHD